jgi:FAD/FMN-containing dehydrogenase
VLARRDRWQALAGVGIAWVGVEGPEELATLRATVAETGGIAPAISGAGGLGASPVPAPEVHRRLKAAFDPHGVLAPGRFWGE